MWAKLWQNGRLGPTTHITPITAPDRHHLTHITPITAPDIHHLTHITRSTSEPTDTSPDSYIPTHVPCSHCPIHFVLLGTTWYIGWHCL
eukprot:1162094-Pelagomonas_calceolata.AAC.5